MQLHVLGPLEVVSAEGVVNLGGAKVRAVLALLAVHVNEAVSEDRLIEVVWGDSAPRTATKTLRSYVSRLRAALAPGEGRLVIDTTPGGYRLRAAEDVLDVARVEALAKQAREATERGDHAWAAVALTEALRTWRGQPLGEFSGESWAAVEAARLSELRETLLEERVDAELACGRHAALLPELEALTSEHPLRERLWGQRMVALYRSGRQADALRVYQGVRVLLADELGIEPSHELRRLEQQVLAQDHALDWSVTAPPPSPTPGPSLPSGVVTFLLTDIEGSTALWDTTPEAMAQALTRHDALVRGPVEFYGGVFLKARGEGDSTFSVFARATDAVAAARAVQKALIAEVWPTKSPLRVRMALHTGEAVERDGDYYGPAVNRVARLRDLAAGGQILVSRATRDVAVDHLPAECTLVDLGSQELRDLARPETVYRLSVPAAEGSAAVELAAQAAVPLPARLATPLFQGFHGRVAEREALAQRLKEAAGGERRVVLIAGEAGIGKTELASEFARTAFGSGATVLYGRCDEGLGSPYQPWVEALNHLVASHSRALLERLGARRLADLARLVPALADHMIEPTPPVVDPEAERYLLFGSVVAALDAAAVEAPVVLVMDDLHWADVPSLLLLRHVLGSADPLRMLVIGTYRDSDLSFNHPLTDVLAALRRESGVERVTLGGLADDEFVAVLESASGQPLGGAELDLVHAVYRETDGNPFFGWEIMLHLTEIGAVALDDKARWVVRDELDVAALPDSVREVIGRRVARLGDDVRRTLSVAAVIGRDFGLDVLAAALDQDPESVLEQLERAEAATLVITVSPGRFSFVHALIGHTLASDLTPTRRSRTHRRVAEAIEQLGLVDDHLPELANHWQAATAPADAPKAIEYARRAGDQAIAALAPDEARRWYQQAIDLVGRNNEPLRCGLLLGLGEAQRQAGDPAYRETLLDAAHLAAALGDTDRLVRAALANTRFGIAGIVDSERIAVLEGALAVVGEQDSEARARLLVTLAVELAFSGDSSRRRSLADEALGIARRLDDAATFVRVVGPWATAILLPENLAERRAVTAEAVALAESLGDPAATIHVLQMHATTSFEVGDADEIERDAERLMLLADEIGQPTLRWLAGTYEVMRVLLAGDAETAETLATRVMAQAQETGQPDALIVSGASLLAIRRHQGREREFVDFMAQAADSAPGIPAARAAVALLKIESGMQHSVEVTLADLDALPYDMVWLHGTLYWAEVACRLSARDVAEALYERLQPHREFISNNSQISLGSVAHYLGTLATVLERFDEAEAHFEQAEITHDRMRAPFHLARTHLEWGHMLLARGGPGDSQRATELLERALVRAREFGCAGVERRATEALAFASRVSLPAALISDDEHAFVGREGERRQITATWDAVKAASRRTVLIAGEPGIGKTRLAAEVGRELFADGATVLYGRCDEELGAAYQPFSEALGDYIDSCPVADLQSYVERRGGDLVRIVPELGRRLPSLPPPSQTDPDAERLQLFDAAVALLVEASQRAPIVLVLDDLQWATKPTLMLLRHLVRSPEAMAVLVIGTYRDTELGRTHPLAEVLADLRRESGVARLALSGLDEGDVVSLVEVSGSTNRSLAKTLHDQTQGNPFFLGEVLRHLADTPESSERDLPEGIREVISRRVSRLSPECNTVLTMSSVIGAVIPLALLEALFVGELTGGAILDALDEATSARVLVEVADRPGHFSFAHALLRQTLYAELSTARRVRLHRRVGEAIELLSPGRGSLDALAYHFAEAATDGQVEKAAGYGLQAALAAFKQLAFEEAIADAERALAVLELAPEADNSARFELWLMITEACGRLLDRDRAKVAGLAAVEIARTLDSPERRARAAVALLYAFFGSLEQDADVVEAAESALSALDDDGSLLRAQLLAVLVGFRAQRGIGATSEDAAREALAVARAAGDGATLLVALEAVSWALLSTGQVDEALAIADEHIVLATASGDRLQQANGHYWRASNRLALGDRVGFEADIETVAALATSTRSLLNRLRIDLAKVCRALLDGRFEDVDSLAAEVLAESGEDPGFLQAYGAQLFFQAFEQGRVAELKPMLADLAGQDHTLPGFSAILALALAESGAIDDARAVFEELAADDFDVLRHDQAWRVLLQSLAELTVHLGDAGRAETLLRLYDGYQGLTVTVSSAICLGAADRYLAMLAMTAGRLDEAAELLESALALEESVDSPPLLARTRYWYARFLIERGDPHDQVRAVAMLDQSIATAESLGMASLLAQATALHP